MEIEDSIRQNSKMNPFLDHFLMEMTEEDDNETVIDFGPYDDTDTIDAIHNVITDGLEDTPLDQNNDNSDHQMKGNDSDVEIVANCMNDDFLLGSQLMAKKLLEKRQTTGSIELKVSAKDDHKKCETLRQKEKQIRVQMEIELELERQQRIQFQKQLEEYMNYSLRRQFDDSKQIKSLRTQLLKCRQELQTLKKSVKDTNDSDLNSNDSTINSNERLFSCLDCSSQMKSEISMILHLINHCIEEEEFQLETSVFRLDPFTDSMVDSIRKTVSYCCPRCNQSFNCLEIYYHLYKSHSKERPLICSECKAYCTHLDYWREHIQTLHNGIIQSVTYVDIAQHIKQPLRAQPSKQPSNVFNGHSRNTSNAYKPYTTNRLNNILKNNGNPIRNIMQSNSYDDSETTEEDDDSDTPEVIQLSDSPPPPKSVPMRATNFGQTSGPKTAFVATEFKCDFPDCDFQTNSKDKLDFHTGAHTNSKFKCPYCPYVGNILNDIIRHILKSKKHDGFKVYECRECRYGTNCLSSFKEHLQNKHFDSDSDSDEDVDEYITDMFRNQHSTNNSKTDS